ncbi:MAG: DNA polymerase III subunit gamma/tau [Treponema sp.]
MAYEVTATRRRPQKFEDLIGQEFVAETLKNSIQSGKIAHAYLFSGPRGCGKTSTARILAKALNCEKGPTATPCGTCSACTEITKGSSLDVIEIDGASNTSVNDVRQIKDEVLFPPNSCRYKIYIIDEVHMLSTSAFNALLKTIEEPPPYVIFIFATTELQKVPATIKSRCQQFNFRLVPIEKVKNQLSKAAEEIGIKADEEALYWIARESTGSMRDAYTLFDQVAAFSDGEITYDKIRDKLGVVGVDRLNELFTLCSTGDVTSALTKIDEYLQNGISIEQLISNCTDYLRSILLIKSGITKEALLGQAPERYAKEVLSSWNNIQIERALDIFLQLYRDIRYSLNSRYELELAVSRLCWLKEYVSAAEVKRAVDSVRPLLMQSAGSNKVQMIQQEPHTVPQNNAASDQQVQTQQANVQSPSFGATSSPAAKQYVPHFGAMDSAPQSNEVPPDSSGGVPHPFLNGGAVPPVNYTVVEASSPSVNNISSRQNDSDSTDDYEDAEEGSYAPDDSSEENFISDDAVGNPNEKNNMPQNQTVENSQVTATEKPFPNAKSNNAPLTEIEKLRESIINDFSMTEAILASALMRAKNWLHVGDKITVTVESDFDKLKLQSDMSKITPYLAKYYGKSVSFEVQVEQKKEEVNLTKDLPQDVQLVRDTFKGSVVSCI